MWNFIKTAVETLFRFFPFPVKPGLRTFGSPDRTSPVFVTANFDLTVRRVSKVLSKLNCYLLVVNTQGINVWCAAGGKKFTANEVVSAIKTSGINELVDHRKLILPQFCAPGVDIQEIVEKTGWHAQFGPAYAKDIPRFVANGFKKTPDMNLARFPLGDRMEMAVAWAFFVSLIPGVIFAIWWPQYLLGVLALTWVLALGLFGFLLWIPGKQGFVKALVGAGAVIAVFVIYYLVSNQWESKSLIGWALAAVVLSLVMGFDIAGSTPLWAGETSAIWVKLGWIKNPVGFKVAVDPEVCTGCTLCVQVCPKAVYEMHGNPRKAVVARPEECEECSACYVQCYPRAITLGFSSESKCNCPPCKITEALSGD